MDKPETESVRVGRTVRDLMLGSKLTFTDSGTQELKGVSEPWQLFALLE